MEIVNLTPHSITFESENGEWAVTIPAAREPARVAVQRVRVGTLVIDEADGFEIPVNQTRFGQVENLPEPRPGVAYVVSRVVAEAVQGRDDLYVVDDTVRDEQGRVVAARALAKIGG